jgi:hypothetical protein
MEVRKCPPIGVVLYDCDFCGFTYEKRRLKSQRGGLACPTCYDKPVRVKRKARSRL